MTIEPYVWSYSELQDLRQCPFKHQLRWTERWVEPQESRSQRIGHRWHEMMATFYGQRVGPDRVGPRTAARRTIRRHLNDDTEEDQLLHWMFDGYVEYWEGNRDWIIRAVEFSIVVPVWKSLHLKIRADLVVRLRGTSRLFLVDSKTSAYLPRPQELQLDAQYPLYVWALRKAGMPIWGAIRDAVRTKKNKIKESPLEDRFARTLIYHNPQQLEGVARDGWTDIAKTTTLVYPSRETTPPDQPRHLDPERCLHRCPFTEPCIAGLRGGDTRRFLSDLGFKRDPTRH